MCSSDLDLAAGLIAQLGQLKRRQVCAHGASGIAKAGLPQRGQIEQSFHQDDGGAAAHRIPGKQAALGARQQPVWESGADTAAVEVHQGAGLAKREDHTAAEGVASLGSNKSGFEQSIEAITMGNQMVAQLTDGGSIADAQFFDEAGAQPTSLEIMNGFGVTMELELVERSDRFQPFGIGSRRDLPLEVGNALAKRETLGQSNKTDQVAATAATVTVEQILGSIDT